MEQLGYLLGPCIGLLGWAATGLWALGADRLNETEKRAMILCTWIIWMLPGLGTLVMHGLLTMTGLMLICSISTVLLTVVLLGGKQHWRTKP